MPASQQLPGLAPLVPKFYRAPRRYKSILERAAKVTGYSQAEIVGAGRTRALSHVRFAIMLVLRRRGLSFPVIGRLLGNRDHTTVMHGCERAQRLIETDADFGALLDLVAVK